MKLMVLYRHGTPLRRGQWYHVSYISQSTGGCMYPNSFLKYSITFLHRSATELEWTEYSKRRGELVKIPVFFLPFQCLHLSLWLLANHIHLCVQQIISEMQERKSTHARITGHSYKVFQLPCRLTNTAPSVETQRQMHVQETTSCHAEPKNLSLALSS